LSTAYVSNFAANFDSTMGDNSVPTIKVGLVPKIRAIAELYKLRLAMLVVVSAILGYLLGCRELQWNELFVLCLGGFLLTGGSNGMNQVWERDYDKLMDRTRNRPIPTGRLSVNEALLASGLAAVAGIVMLWTLVSSACGILGLFAFFSYVFLYTPLKRVSSLAVFVGAFPGAVAPLLGYVAADNYGIEAGSLFAMQFMWQFPHFWAIAWVAHDDYIKGGYNLLPLGGKTKASAFQILIYSLFLIPVSLLLWVLPLEQPIVGNGAAIVAVLSGLVMVWYAVKLYRSCDVKDARRLMFASFFYLPVVQLAYVLDRLG
jgi:heme o synthase